MPTPSPRILVRAPQADAVTAWRQYGWRAAPDPAALDREHEAFCRVLEESGATVTVGRTPVPGDPDAIYVRDPVLIAPGGVIALRPGKEGRREEPAAVSADIARLGVPSLSVMPPPATAEGGDMFFLDAATLLVGRSYRTNDEGVRFLAATLPGVELIAFDLPHLEGADEVLHLMSLISPVDVDLAVVYPPLMPVRCMQLLARRGVRLVEVPPEEFATMGPNVLAVGPRVAVVREGSPVTRRRLEAAGVEVRAYVGEDLSGKGDGGPTCLTLPLDPLA
ncbi:MAG TPA: arginine deiminase family protein [Verrucomicrobiae bacterium]|nr:arginine deiminase family protein [Verrucomicrobiae bacterium]